MAELSAAKAEAEEEAKRYQIQVAQQRQGLSKNRVRHPFVLSCQHTGRCQIVPVSFQCMEGTRHGKSLPNL